MKVICVKIPDELFRRLEILEKIENDSRSAVIRRAIDYYYIWRIHIEPKKVRA